MPSSPALVSSVSHLKKIVVPAYAKVNLYLDVHSRRSDGYHDIRTVFERISLADSITIRERPDEHIRVSCHNSAVPHNEGNLCYKAAVLLKDRFRITRGLDISIVKRIPVGAGLGGGSSNAAAVLLGLRRLWGLKITTKELAAMAAHIGSDVAFFVHEVPYALGTGRGEKIKPLAALEKSKLWHVIISPRIHVSTPVIYRAWDRQNDQRKKTMQVLTASVSGGKLLTLALKKNKIYGRSDLLYNSLEDITCSLYPEVQVVIRQLGLCGVPAVRMSGSGPSVFCLLSSENKAVSLRKKLLRKRKAWRIFVARTL